MVGSMMIPERVNGKMVKKKYYHHADFKSLSMARKERKRISKIKGMKAQITGHANRFSVYKRMVTD